jgi:tetratricopeptide (TPR) repeat protein
MTSGSQDPIEVLISNARQSMVNKDWGQVEALATQILDLRPDNAEGFYLAGVVSQAARNYLEAIERFQTGLKHAPNRYDIAIQLANSYSMMRRNGDAADILAKYASTLHHSPRYLDLAGTIYTEIGLAERAWPLFERANELQPGVDVFQANLATCAVFLGKIDQARGIYLKLLERFPDHRKNH